MNGTIMIFAIFDQKAQAFMRPWGAPTIPFALRIFGDMAQTDEVISKHPEDYCLFKLADMSEDHGEVSPDKQSLGFAIEHLQPTEDTP